MIWTDDTRQAVIEEIATTFAEENGITVAVQELEFGQIREQLSLAAPAGDGPDIVIGAHDWLGELVSNGVLEPLDISAIAGNFQDVSIDAFTYDGQTYGLPYAVENIALVRNTELAPEAPATFEDMITAATEFKAQHADDPTYQGLALQVGPEGDGYHLQPILSAFGGYIFAQNEDGTFNPDDLGIDSPGALGGGDVPVHRGGERVAQRRHDLRRDDRLVRQRQGAVRDHRTVGRSARTTTGSRRRECRTPCPRSRPARVARHRRSSSACRGS